MIRPAVKYLFLLVFCVFIPITMNGVYSNVLFLLFKWVTLDPVISLDTYYYLGYLSLVLVFVFSIIVYPLKSLIQSRIGSLYSYLYALSVISLLGLWPFYSILK
jgi:hypothetical protein